MSKKAAMVNKVMEYLIDPLKPAQGPNFSIAKTGLHSLTMEQLRALERLLYWKRNNER